MNTNPALGSPSMLLRESNREKENILTTPATAMEFEEEEQEEPERHAINPLLSPTKSTRLTMGSRVIILGTDNVEQRVPHLVGVEAQIVVVPVHPATWFKVKFDNGKIVTFRPSALRLVSDGTTVDSNYSPPPKKTKATCRPRSNSLKTEHTKTSLQITVPTDGQTKLLTSIHTDLWPGCRVRILSGRLTGHTGNVLGSGNGWVQLESSYGELAKRANELELLSRGKSSTSTLPSQTDTVANLPPSSSSSATVRPSVQRRRSNSEPGSPTEISNRRNEFSTKNNLKKERKEMDLQREHVQRYIDKQQAKIGTRPDLKYWLSRIQGTMVDPKFERNVSRDVRSHFCHSCYMEMWSGSKYCWNEMCSMSPVYWKLPGAAGSPPLKRYQQAAASSSSNSSGALKVEVALEDSAYACEVLLSLRSDIRMPPTTGNTAEKKASLEPEMERSTVTFAPMNTPSSSASSSSDHHHQRVGNKRKISSDSSHTDSEDQHEDYSGSDVTPKSPNTLKLRIKLSPPRSLSQPVSPRSLPSSSPRKQQSSPRPNSTSPRLNFKRIRMTPSSSSSPSSSPFLGVQGAPPSAEEFARIVMQHEQQQQQQQQPQQQQLSHSSASASLSRGPLPGLISTQLPNPSSTPFNSLTGTSPLLTSMLNPDYPTNKAIMANVLEENQTS